MEMNKKRKTDREKEVSSDKCSESEPNEQNETVISEDVILKNLKKIDESISKLEEIEKKLSEDIAECDKFIQFYDKSKALLDSKDFNSDVGREEEISEIRNILKRCSSKCVSEGIFLTGPSGQGKTYSIFYLLNEIEKEKDKKNKKKEKTECYKNIDPSHYYVSCSNCEKPYDIFVDILQQIINKDKKVILNEIKQKYNLNGLDEVKKVFINYTSKLNNLKIIIVDELDFIAVKNARMELKTKTQTKNTSEDIIKNLFECVSHNKCKIILVGIANSFDLLKDYTHMKINQIIYKPYTEKQFMNIIKHKLNSLEDEMIQKIFKGVSLNIHVRQISNRSGDIRSCFDAILRVFSEKRSTLSDRKNILLKLKEEIAVNKIFNEQEKRHLIILSEKKKKEQPEKGINVKQESVCEEKNVNNENEEIDKIGRKRKKEKGEQTPQSAKLNKKAKTETETETETDVEKMSQMTETATTATTTTDKNVDIEEMNKQGYKKKNEKETLSKMSNTSPFNRYDNNEDFFNFDESSPLFYSDKNSIESYESPFKILYKNVNEVDSNDTPISSTTTTTPKNKKKKKNISEIDSLLNNININKFVSAFEGIVDNQIKNFEKKYEVLKTESANKTVMISDIKKVTDKMPLEEHTDILFKIKSLPLIQKIYLYASCNVINDEHLNSDEEDNEKANEETSQNRNIEITYADIQRSYRVLCSQLSETSHIRDILEGSTIDQAIEHFEELGILTNSKKGKEKTAKTTKGLSPRFITKKNTKNFSSQNKINSVYNFNLPIKVIKQTLKDISSILSAFDGSN